MIVLFGLFPLQQSDLITELLSLAARSFFAWVGGKLAVSYFEDSQSGGWPQAMMERTLSLNDFV